MSRDLRLVDGDADEPYENLDDADRAAAGQARARSTGNEFVEYALTYVEQAGAKILHYQKRPDGAVNVDARIVGENHRPYWLIGHGTIDDGPRAGLKRTDTVLKAVGAAYLLNRMMGADPIILITSHLPKPASASAAQLAGARDLFWDVLACTDDLPGYHRLGLHLNASNPELPVAAPWRTAGKLGQLNLEEEDLNA